MIRLRVLVCAGYVHMFVFMLVRGLLYALHVLHTWKQPHHVCLWAPEWLKM